MKFFSAAFRVTYKVVAHANLRVFTRVYDVRRGGGGGQFFLKIDFFWYNSWVSVDPTLTVSIPDYASCIYSSELFKVRQRRAIFHNKLQNVFAGF